MNEGSRKHQKLFMVVHWRPFHGQIIRCRASLFAEYRRRCYSVAMTASKPFDNVDVFEQGNGKPYKSKQAPYIA